MTYQVDSIMNNGARVIAIHDDIVLASFRGEYVTWKLDSEGNAYFGHYYQDSLVKAVEDFAERTGREHSKQQLTNEGWK
jgi:hypothetical protein